MEAASLLEGLAALAPDDPEPGSLEERVLDAALARFADLGLERTTVEDVARAAGVSRVTVYRRFGAKSALIDAVLLREARRFLGRLESAVSGLEGIEARTVEGFATSLRLAREHPLIGGMLERDPGAVLPHLTVNAAAALGLAREFLARQLEAGQRAGEVPEIDCDEVAELVVRLAFSFVLTPGGVFDLDDEAAAREFARRYFVPVLTGTAGSARPARP